MKTNYYDFFGKLLLEVRGEGGRSTGQFRTMYDHFEVVTPDREPDVVVERTTEPLSVQTVLGNPDDHFGWTGSRFVVRKGSEYMAVEPGWKHIYVTPNWEPFYAIYPIEFQLRSALVEDRQALIHASGVELDGRTVLFPAWRGGGKTNTLISLLEAGGNFLADDRLWVGADGSVRGFPLAVNLQPYNIESFPAVQAQFDDSDKNLRRRVSRLIEDRVDPSGSFVGKAVTFLNRYYIKERSRSFTKVSRLFPTAKYIDDSTVDELVFLMAAPSADRVTIEELTDAEALDAMQAISFYEWNERLEEYFRAYDALVPGGSAVDHLDYVVEAENRVFAELFETVGTHRALVPRKSNWGETGTDREMVDAIRSLAPRKVEASD